jgi:Mlc titration factor MtfA (ptsG expression regulator)
MEALLASLALAAAVALAWLGPGWRLRRALARPLDAAHVAILERNVAQYRGMPAAARRQLERLVQQFLFQKKFVGCAGLELTDEMRLTIAGQACLLLLGRGQAVYPGLDTVLVYPGAFLAPRREVDAAGVVTERRQDLLGESWGDGRVVLSWEHVRRAGVEAEGAHNVVLHEFAHQLDSESGSTNGAPYLGSRASYRSWAQVLSRDYANLRAEAFFGEHGVLDHYGATSPAEFFAVATESYFEQPWRLAARHPALYDEFLKYYRVDPRDWCAEPGDEPEPEHGHVVYGQWQ